MAALIGLQDGVADDEQRLGRRIGADAVEAAHERQHALRFRGETVSRLAGATSGCAEALRRTAHLQAARFVVGQEESDAPVGLREQVIGLRNRLQSAARAAIGLVLRIPEGSDKLAQCSSPHAPPADLAAERLFGISGTQTEPLPKIGERVVDAARLALRRGPLDPAAEIVAPAMTASSASPICMSVVRSASRRTARPRRDSGPAAAAFITSSRRGRAHRGRRIVQDGELARHVRLEGKLVQQPLAEGVDRLDLQPARRLQRPGEEPPRLAQLLPGGRAPFELGDRRRELGLVEHRPFAERAEDAARHLRGGDLGEGQAEDRGRIGAGEQQADHALGQHVVLPEPALAITQADARGSDASR